MEAHGAQKEVVKNVFHASGVPTLQVWQVILHDYMDEWGGESVTDTGAWAD